MKINWGTGILIFMILFLTLAISFIIFTSQLGVNLVHKDYYEKGVDYTSRMKMDARSVKYKNAFDVSNSGRFMVVDIDMELSEKIDSGRVILFRPSDSNQDVFMQVEPKASKLTFPKKNLLHGRYILKFSWFSQGVKYEIDKPVNVQ
jgi:hypothetical protein